MAAVHDDSDTLGGKVLAALLVLLLVAGIVLIVMGPEPCTDGSGSTACASAPRTAP